MPNEINPNLDVLTRWADEPDTKIACASGRHVLLSLKGERLGFFQWIAQFFSWSNPEINRYAKLNKVLRHILDNEDVDVEKIKRIFSKIRLEFLSLQGSISIVDLIQANDLLEAYSIASR